MEGAHLKLEDLSGIPEAEVPFLHEIWNWEGDTSILPHKWEHMAQMARPDKKKDLTAKYLEERFISSHKFDPQGIFFLTHRSKCMGTAMLIVHSDGSYELGHLYVDSHSVECYKCLALMVIKYAESKGATSIRTLKPDHENYLSILHNLGFK
mmetsp:Transcript_51183/g.58683  ORF Transcript_51183/g.58683 Transcript_51183/m.58683 type:complete len:152 (+) Transcript_51183:42-497(+)